jgi:hypothetical protein
LLILGGGRVDHIAEALIGLGIIVIGALGTMVKLWIDHLAAELAQNTAITTQARDASNGQLSSVLDQLAAERNTVQGLKAVVRDRDDRLAYLLSRIPQVEALMQEYSDRRATRTTEADMIAVEQHLLSQ